VPGGAGTRPGHFLAYLRFATLKAAGGDERVATLADDLEAAFLDGYRAGGSPPRVGAGRIRVYEMVSLLRLAVHAWQKMKPERLGYILSVLDARVASMR
jgi:hypothetical protein